jgi:tripartite-type tricarboxylate transporter receptor subunit TctC
VSNSAIVRSIVAIGLALGAVGSAAAQSYPSKPIKLIVPVAAGGPLDTLARLASDKISAKLGQPVIVENRAGAGTSIGARIVATAEPDGYTLLWASSATLAILPALYTKLDFDPKTFVPVALVAKLPHVLVVPPEMPAKTVQELAAYAKAHPGQLNYGASLGTPPHLMGAMFAKMSGADLTFIPYKGAAPSITDLLGGQTQLTFDALMTLMPLIQEGKLRALAITSPTRWPGLPDVPTMAEAGFPGFPGDSWNGVVAPAGTPAAIVNKLNAAINEGMGTADVKETMTKLVAVPSLGSPRDFAAWIASQSPIWAEMVKVAGARID